MLSERRENLLNLIVEEYVESAVPVGSKSIVEKHRVPYSSATVRIEMARLEDEGHQIAKLKNKLVVFPTAVRFLRRHLMGGAADLPS